MGAARLVSARPAGRVRIHVHGIACGSLCARGPGAASNDANERSLRRSGVSTPFAARACPGILERATVSPALRPGQLAIPFDLIVIAQKALLHRVPWYYRYEQWWPLSLLVVLFEPVEPA